ncbi:Disintegrin and metalloproteinase domain-containing protein 9 (ADAM 9) (Cellular disintegrin-related protein) (Meltrin-gamma) (Metalloprotease/disintegrin/cysteine-rich protein 9) (Myeloma cell metalloproteinase) [Durusdinium trenchii]|uniref:Peptidase M12B domain-containing protein n=1 Tax=Durusdinium trenchii TaxID=1381693 RepID=A0ABP0RZ66_9DINO
MRPSQLPGSSFPARPPVGLLRPAPAARCFSTREPPRVLVRAPTGNADGRGGPRARTGEHTPGGQPGASRLRQFDFGGRAGERARLGAEEVERSGGCRLAREKKRRAVASGGAVDKMVRGVFRQAALLAVGTLAMVQSSAQAQPLLSRPGAQGTVMVEQDKDAEWSKQVAPIELEWHDGEDKVLKSVRIELGNGETVTVELAEAKGLLRADYVEQDSEGNTVRDGEHHKGCHFRGQVLGGSQNGVAAVSHFADVVTGLVILQDGSRHYLRYTVGSNSTSLREADVARRLEGDDASAEAHDGEEHLVDHSVKAPDPKLWPNPTLQGSAPQAVVQRNVNLPDTLFVEVFAVSDREMIASFNGNQNQVSAEVVAMMNHVDLIYEQSGFTAADVRVVLVGQRFQTSSFLGVQSDQSGEHDSLDVLNNFNDWRTANFNSFPAHDAMHLISGKDFDGGTVGLAFIDTICDKDEACNQLSEGFCFTNPAFGCCLRRAGAISQMFAPTTVQNAEVIAHEIGHQFAFEHDSDGNACSSSGFVMAAFTNQPNSNPNFVRAFSSCSGGTFNAAFRSSPDAAGFQRYQCLANVPSGATDGSGSGSRDDDGNAAPRVLGPKSTVLLLLATLFFQ